MTPSLLKTGADVRSLFGYVRWANTRILDALQTSDAVPEEAVQLFSHLLRARDVWYGRVQETDHADLALWVDEDLASCAERREKSAQRWRELIEPLTADALDGTVSYTNSKGTAFDTPLRDILVHVLNHGTHHRAQIALTLREADIAPPPTDYIYYVRERDSEEEG